jgi:hypothetical protein
VGINKLFDHYFDQKIAWKVPTEVHQPARMMMAQMNANKASSAKEGVVAKQYTPLLFLEAGVVAGVGVLLIKEFYSKKEHTNQ